MISEENELKARFLFERGNEELCHDILSFRKAYFVDYLGWPLQITGDIERDEFDRGDTVHCAFTCGNHVAGTFRAIRCDRPYLANTVFPYLATKRNYPRHADCWEISRFGIAPSHKHISPLLYGLMFHFALSRNIKALVAIVDAAHEKRLKKIGLKVLHYGPLQAIGTKPNGEPLFGVAGEIPLIEENLPRLRSIIKLTHHMEIVDETFVFRSGLLSA